jgi:hypothetical protein
MKLDLKATPVTSEMINELLSDVMDGLKESYKRVVVAESELAKRPTLQGMLREAEELILKASQKITGVKNSLE